MSDKRLPGDALASHKADRIVASAPASIWRRALEHRSFLAGSILTSLLAGMALLSLFWTPHNPTRINIRQRLASPSLEHWLGTDQFGRDILSIIMTGAQNSIMVGVVA
ncbi:MAG TPA: hypothetical protein QF882_06345, partial [Arenicellales bacterium]|nr:hypothetical protein [Arenicellales bacterium]